MQIPPILLIVFACGSAVSGLTCYVCSTTTKSSLGKCSGSHSPTTVCATAVGNDSNVDMVCTLAKEDDKEVRGCVAENICQDMQKKKPDIVCCKTDRCNNDAPIAASTRTPPASAASATPASAASDSVAPDMAANTSRISVNRRLLAVLLLLPIIYAMYNTYD